MSWKTLGGVPPADLIEARLQLHHAAQVVASAGVAFLEPQPDDSHPNLGWVDDLEALVGRAMPGRSVRVGLRLADRTLLLVDDGGRVIEEFALEGNRLQDAYAWMEAALTRAGVAPPQGAVRRADYQIPEHPVGVGAAFPGAQCEPFEELARWFANAQQALGERVERTAGTSELRCWPHHFDLGALTVVATQPDGSLSKSIGIGLSPGDADYAEPYYYVSPWPYPEASALPELSEIGHWHTRDYTSAILTAAELQGGSTAGQSERLDRFLNAALAASRILLAG